MHFSVVAIIMLTPFISAIPFDSLRARDTGLCGSVGGSCQTSGAACCVEHTGFAFCDVDVQTVEFASCDFECAESQGLVSCTSSP
jgi:hypothetical protein